MIAVPVVASIGILYNSPFALFLPQLEEGETVPSVTMEKVTEFQNRVNRIAEEHRGCDSGEIVYVNSSNGQEVTNNYYDIPAVYMVKYGIGETAAIINDISKRWIQSVVDNMCSYTTQVRTVTHESTDEDGNTTTTTEKILTVRGNLKTYKDMADIYGFDKNQRELLEQIMSPEFMGQIGWAGGTDDGTYDPGKCSLTEAEIEAILSSITDPVQRQVCSYVLHRVGYPYSQEYRDSGNYYDCSSLAFYAWKSAGVNISHGGSTTAAEEAKGLEQQAIRNSKQGEATAIGSFHGFTLIVKKSFNGFADVCLRGKSEYTMNDSGSPVGSMIKLENLFNNMHREKEILENKIEQYTSDLAASKEEYEKPFLHEKELEEKLARQCELNAQLDLENSKTVDADIRGITEESERIKVAEPTRNYGRSR